MGVVRDRAQRVRTEYSTATLACETEHANRRENLLPLILASRLSFLLFLPYFFFFIPLYIRELKDTEYAWRCMGALSEHIDRFGLYGSDEEDIHPHAVATRHARRHRVHTRDTVFIHEDPLLIARPVAAMEWPITIRWQRDKNKRSHALGKVLFRNLRSRDNGLGLRRTVGGNLWA